MTRDMRPASTAEAELRRMLQKLGQGEEPSTRDTAQESAREARMSAKMDAELDGLMAARRWRRRALYGVVSVAALLALTLGARHALQSGGSLAISPEPASSAKVSETLPPSPSASFAAAPPAVPSVGPRPSAPAPVVVPSPSGSPGAASSVEPASTLAEENQLFKEAADAARKGDVDAAVSRLDRLLLEHPASPLAQAALVRKFRLLAKAGRADQASREAKRYLAVFPTGFAVSEAQALQADTAGQGAP